MTTLGKLKTMSDKDIQNWLRKVEKEGVNTLVTALLRADDEVKNCVYRNMSDTAGAALRKEVEQAQQKGIDERRIKDSASKLEKLE